MKRFIFALIILMSTQLSFGQLDTKHFIPPLYGRTNVQDHYMILSTPTAAAVTVNVMDGTGTLLFTQVISDVAPATVFLGNGYGAPGIINTNELNTVNPTDGFIVEASAPIYVNLRHVQNAQGLSLNSKGASTGLGTRFRSGHIYSSNALPHVKAHEISVMASEDNTTVTFSDISPNVIFRNTPTTAGTSNDITVVLNEGESYTIAAWVDEPGATGNVNDVNGTLVTSDKPIACNTGSWLSGAHDNLRDIGVDQIVPADLIGKEYIFVEGDGNANTERPLIVAEYNNTQIFVNGNAAPVATINAGDYYYLPQTAYSANDNIYIETSEPVFMYQSLSGASPAATSLNFIPPLRCNGFKKVVIPSVNLVGVPTVSITARTNASVYVNGSATPLTGGLTVPGNNCWVTYKIPGGTGDFLVESDSIINVALLTLQGPRGSAGYFTGFAQFVQLDQGDTTSFIVCEDSASSYTTYSIEGPYIDVTADFHDPSLNGQITIDGFSNDSLFFTYIGDPNTTGPDSLSLTVCKLLDCCGAIPDTICEVSTLVFTNIADIQTGIGDSIVACSDTSDIALADLLLGTPDPNGYWVDTDGTGALFGNNIDMSALNPGVYHFTYYVDGGSICFDSTVATVNVLPMSSSTCCSIAPTFTLQDPSCNTYTDGSVLITDQYATSFSLDGGTTTQGTGSFNGIGANTYNVNLTFGPDCSYDTTLTITEPAPLTSTFTIDSVSCFGNCDGQISASVSGGTAPYTYSIGGTAAQTSPTFSALCAGPATITITDTNNCQVVYPNTIFQPDLLILNETAHTDETCSQSNGQTTVTPQGGTPPYTYTINAGAPQSNSTFTGLSANNYTIEVTDANGCTATETVTIIDNPSPVPYVDVLNHVTCAGGINGSVTIGVNFGTAPFQYSLDAGASQGSNTFPSVSAGNHTVVVTDDNGCTGSVNFTINQPTALVYNTTITDASCFGDCDGTIDISASGAVPPYQYSDDNGMSFQASNVLTGLCAGNVNVVVQDANGCLANSVEIINQPTALTSVQGFVDPDCHQTPTGQISFAPSGGTPTYQFSVDNGSTFTSSSPVTGLMAGTYDVIVQDANGCEYTDQITLTDPPPFTFNFIGNNPSNCGANDGSFEITASSGTAPYFYSIDGGVTQQVNNGFFDNLYSGLYNLVVTDADGCTDSVYSALSDNVMTTQTDVTVDVTCFGGSDGLGIVSQQFGAPPFSYTLNTSTTSQPTGVFAGLSAGTYYVTIQDNGNCLGIEQFEIFEPDSITFDNALTHITCPNGADGEIVFNNVNGGDGGPYTYSIDGGTNYFATNTFPGLQAGIYNVFAQDGNGCLGQTQVELTEPDTFSTYINASNLVCNSDNTGFIQVVGDGGTSPYQYTVNGSNVTGVFPGLPAATYTITLTDALGCTYDTVQVISEPAQLGFNVNTVDALCFGSSDGSIEVLANGGTAPYLYSDDSGNTLQSSNTLGNLQAGCYDVYVEDDNGCSTLQNHCIGQPTQLNMTLATNPATCGQTNAEISVTAGGGTPGYLYSNDDGANFQPGNIFNGLSAIPYDIVLQDNNGCEIDTSITLTADPQPQIDNVALTHPLCFNGNEGSITILSSNGVGGHQYSITSAAGPYQGSNLFNTLTAGTYDVFVQDGNGCVVSSQVDIVEPAQLQLNTVVTDLSCFQNNSGQLQLTATGGTTPYQYSIDNGLTTQGVGTFNNLVATDYDLFVEDANGCQLTDLATVNEPTELTINPNIIMPSCYGYCDGTVTANANGGTIGAGYQYNWSSNLAGPSDDQANGVCTGTYSLIVTDANGCQVDTLNLVVDEPDEAIIDSVVTTGVLCHGDANGTVTIYSANAGFYSLGGAFTTNTNYTGLTSDFYTAYVQDVNGCPGDSADVFVSTPQPLLGFVTPDEYICQGDSIYFSVVGTGGTNPYNFDVNNGASSNATIFEPIYSDTSFFVTITDANGCSYQTDTMQIFVAPPPVLITDNDTTVCPGASLALSSEAADLVETYTYEWNTGDTIPFIYPTVTSDTSFSVTVTDECNLSTHDTIHVFIHPDPAITITPDILGGCPPFQVNYAINVDVSQLSSDLSWSTTYGQIDSSDFSDLYITYSNPGSGNINLSFTSVEGCDIDTTFSNPITVYDIPVANFVMNPSPPSIYDTDVNLVNTSFGYTNSQWFYLSDTVYTEHSAIAVSDIPTDSSISVCLIVSNDSGCSDTTCNSIELENELFLFVPNAILLDGFSENSVFRPVLNYFHPDFYELQIFNRWGELIFETKDVNQGWDGTYNDILVPDGVYVWKITGAPVSNDSDVRTYTGHVTVLK